MENLEDLEPRHKKPRETPLSLRDREHTQYDDGDAANTSLSLTSSQDVLHPVCLLEPEAATQQWFIQAPLRAADPYAAEGVAQLWEKGARLHALASPKGVCLAPYMPLYRGHIVQAAWFTFYSAAVHMLDTLNVTAQSSMMCESALFRGIAAFDVAMSSPRGRTFVREGYGAFATATSFTLDYDWAWEAPDALPAPRSAARIRCQRRLLQLLMGGVLHGGRMDLMDDIRDSTLADVVVDPLYAAQFPGVRDALEPVTHRHTAFDPPPRRTRRSKYRSATTKTITCTPAWFAAEYVMVPSVTGNLPTIWDFTGTLLYSYALATQGNEPLWKRVTETTAAHLMAQHSYAFPLWLAAANIVDFAVDDVGVPASKKPAWTACCAHLAQVEPEAWTRLRVLRSHYRRTVESLNLDHYHIGA